jgi:hypothetical protein
MLRKLNFTERARIPRSDFRVTLRREPDGVLAFDPVLRLQSIAGDGGARVFIEAYHQNSFMRFDCGRVNALSIPADRRLTEIEGSSVRFRVKIVGEEHRILAVADDIRVTEGGAAGQQVPLLPVQFSDAMGQVAWRIAFEPDTPVLELNNQIQEIERIAKESPLFFALVYPAAVREILTQILLVDRHDPFEESDDWWSLWMRWAAQQTSAPLPQELEDAARWIDDVVASFCSANRAVDRIDVRQTEPL